MNTKPTGMSVKIETTITSVAHPSLEIDGEGRRRRLDDENGGKRWMTSSGIQKQKE